MRTHSACYPCFFKQALSSLERMNAPEAKRLEILQAVARLVGDLKPEHTPAYNSSQVLHLVNLHLGTDDPYREAKREYNHLALHLLPGLQERAAAAPDPLEAAIRISVVGNVIDLGIKHEVDLDGTLARAFGDGFGRFELESFKAALDRAQRILYVLDNAGEVFFDRVLIEELRRRGKAVIAAVKAGAILNDATLEDADQAGLTELCRVVDTGCNFVGVERERSSPAFLQVLDGADLVIAKGQGNYETLEGTRPDLFFILKAKCEVVAEHLGVKFGDLYFGPTPDKRPAAPG
jgi:damage-control phosphatase, subfamily I